MDVRSDPLLAPLEKTVVGVRAGRAGERKVKSRTGGTITQSTLAIGSTVVLLLAGCVCRPAEDVAEALPSRFREVPSAHEHLAPREGEADTFHREEEERGPREVRDAVEEEEEFRPSPEIVIDLGGGVTMEFVLVRAGEFWMGAGGSAEEVALELNIEVEYLAVERPRHRVRITKPFYLSKYEVTQAQYERIAGENPSYFKGASNPVERVSWDDAMEFCRRLSQKTGRSFRLPTEAEWEYACRAGCEGKYCFGNDENKLGEYAWYLGNAGRRTHPVGQKSPNAWGLYDMHGHVWEWCADWFDEGYYERSPREDPRGPTSGRYRVFRGCHWQSPPWGCRSADRIGDRPTARYWVIGFRAAMSAAAGP